MRYLNLCAAIAIGSSIGSVEAFQTQFEAWPLETRIEGRLLIATELSNPSLIHSALGRLRGDERVRVLFFGHAAEHWHNDYSVVFSEQQLQLEEFTRAAEFVANVQSAMQTDDVCCLHFLNAASDADRARILKLNDALQTFVRNGKTLLVTGTLITDLKLLPDTLLQSSLQFRDAHEFSRHLQRHSALVGLTVEPQTVVSLNQRRVRVFGEGSALFVVAGREGTVFRQQSIAQQSSTRQPPNDYMIDLTQWRRMALDQTLPEFPGPDRQVPQVANGTLLIAGGGGLPSGLMEQMIELAGGPDEARLVYIPCSEEPQVPVRQQIVTMWKSMGVKHATVVHTKDRRRAHVDEDFLRPLKEATGIWFGGGRQWNFSDSYYGTTAQQLMHDVLKRGGVIGGSSAGASIQADYLARATPIENLQIMAPGYERGGLGFLCGVAIDQHFSERKRQSDMTALVNRYPAILGIGIDETTALVVQKSVARVIGEGNVYFYDRDRYAATDDPDYLMLSSGAAYDLAGRIVIEE
ncbi:MAG: cyanophycinase [Planctomycetaceae bacterium]